MMAVALSSLYQPLDRYNHLNIRIGYFRSVGATGKLCLYPTKQDEKKEVSREKNEQIENLISIVAFVSVLSKKHPKICKSMANKTKGLKVPNTDKMANEHVGQ